MDFQRSKLLLEKINALHKNISGDPDNVFTIERDLMRSYIQQFYDSFLELQTVGATVGTPKQPAAEPKPLEPKITLRRPETAPPPLRPQPEPPKPEPQKVERTPIPTTTSALMEEATAEAEPVRPAPQAVPDPVPAHMPVVPIDPGLEELFFFKIATELSEKLSELPITDIKKGMGLNERISTQNELFGGYQASFDATVATLNQLRNYEEAKDYLLRNVAVKYNWAAKDKKEKAKNFIKYIRRRY